MKICSVRSAQFGSVGSSISLFFVGFKTLVSSSFLLLFKSDIFFYIIGESANSVYFFPELWERDLLTANQPVDVIRKLVHLI